MRASFPSERIFATLLLGLAWLNSFGQSGFTLDDPGKIHRLDGHIEFFIDSVGTLSFTDVLKVDGQGRFTKNTGSLTFGYLKSPVWLKVSAQTNAPQARWMLEIPAPFLEYVDFYQRDTTGGWQRSISGYYRKQSERRFSHTGHLLPLEFGPDAVMHVYVRVGGLSPKTFPVYAMGEERFLEKTRLEDLGYGIFFGILAVMFFYNFFIYLIVRQRNYLYYFCTIVCTFLLFAAISGYGGKFLWPETPILNYFAGKLSLEFLIVFISLFTIRFLEVRKYSKLMDQLLQGLIPLAILAFVLVVTNIFPFAGNTLVTFATLLFITTGIIVRVQGNRMAEYFIAAWTIYLAGGLLIALRNSGVLPYGFWTTHVVEIGAVLETAIIGFALGHQYRRFKREKEEAQLHALRIQEEAMAWLERKVQERTEELTKAYRHLEETLKANERQTALIQDKNSELDSLFYRISHDLKGPVSSALGLTMLAKLEIKDGHALDLFDRLQSQLERMHNIFNGLVRLARLSHSDMQIESIDFDRLIDDCIMSFHSLPAFSKVKFRKEVQPGLQYRSEWTLMNGIIQNLLENAIKYARDEDPYVRIGVCDEGGWLLLEVEDNGQGIAPEHQSRIFDLFYRGTESQSGTGIGLYILKRSVDRLNGTIQVTSEPGSGSLFTVRLPSMADVKAEMR